jgi:hypothetical protein
MNPHYYIVTPICQTQTNAGQVGNERRMKSVICLSCRGTSASSILEPLSDCRGGGFDRSLETRRGMRVACRFFLSLTEEDTAVAGRWPL